MQHALAEIVVAHQPEERRHRPDAGDIQRSHERRVIERRGGDGGQRHAVSRQSDAASVYSAPEMIQRPMALAERDAVAHRAFDVGLRGRDGLLQRRAPGEVRRDRRRERAAGAVRVRPLDARADPLVELALFEQQVDHLRTGQVPALDHHRRRLQHGNAARRLAHVGDAR